MVTGKGKLQLPRGHVCRHGDRAAKNIEIEPTRAYDIEDARDFLGGQGVDVDAIAPQVQDKFMSAFIRATKPALYGAVDAA